MLRISQIRGELHLTAADLGVVPRAMAVGSLLALPAAAVLIRRIGTRVVVPAMTVVTAGTVLVTGVGNHAETAPVVVGLFVMGFGLSCVERGHECSGRRSGVPRRPAIMPRLYAGYSIGTVGSALLGAGLMTICAPVTAHLTIFAVVVAATVLVAAGSFLPDHHTNPAAERTANSDYDYDCDSAVQPIGIDRPRRRLDRRTLLIGIVGLAFAFAEGKAQ